MNSKIFKKPFIKVEITDKNISGSMLWRKLESWCESEPSVFEWEINYNEAPIRAYAVNIEGKQLENSSSRWTIEFQFSRANVIRKDGLFDGVALIAGTIKNTLEMVNNESLEAYVLTLNSRTFKGEETYTSAVALWKVLTTLGIIRPKSEKTS